MTCKQMDTETYQNREVKVGLSDCIFVKIDVSAANNTAKLLNVNAIPTLIAITKDGHVLERLINYLPPEKFIKWLAEIKKKS